MADEYEYQVYNNDTTAARKSRKSRASAEPEQEPPRKRRHIAGKILALLLILALPVLLLCMFLLQTPAAQDGHRDGAYTLLLAGTDGDGTRTDTMMLIYVDTETDELALLSIPRDTLVSLSMSVPKLNGVYGWSGGEEAGMEALMDQIELLLGYRPDGYVLVNFDAVEEIVDILGGVEFDVPVDMEYEDPAQDLYISLTAGVQTLTGEQALWVLRYRSGYALADLERISVQRDLVQAVASQCLSLSTVTKLPQLLEVYQEDVLSDLPFRELVALAAAVMQSDIENAAADTLPGESVWYLGGSYYEIDADAALELLNAGYNPLESEITDLQVVNVVNGVLTVVGTSSDASSGTADSIDTAASDSTASDTSDTAASGGSVQTVQPASEPAETAQEPAQAASAEPAQEQEPAPDTEQVSEQAPDENPADSDSAGGTDLPAETEQAGDSEAAAEPAGDPETAPDGTDSESETAEPAGEASGSPEPDLSEILPTD